jgi:hypothetical protein
MRVLNKYDAAGCCTICNGVVRHEPWCVMVNKEMEYAFLLAVNPTIITEGDTIESYILWACCGIPVPGITVIEAAKPRSLPKMSV